MKSPTIVRARVPASTSNLGSGFDTFGLALKLYLTVEMAHAENGLQISVSGAGASKIPANEKNLIYKSIKNFYETLGQTPPALNIKIENEIPLFRGLGSSGAATIAGLVGARELSGADMNDEELLSFANEMEGHPENAAASLLGGLTINCQADGEIISQKVKVDENLKAVLLIPEIQISTHKARQVLPKDVPHTEAVFNVQRSALLAHAFITHNYSALKTAMQDKLHQPFRKHLIPGYDEFEAIGYENGALGICISGSGSTILGMTLGEGSQLQKCWEEKTKELGLNTKVRVVGIEINGATLIKC